MQVSVYKMNHVIKEVWAVFPLFLQNAALLQSSDKYIPAYSLIESWKIIAIVWFNLNL